MSQTATPLAKNEYNYVVRVSCPNCKKSKDFVEKRNTMGQYAVTPYWVAEIINSCLWGCNKKKAKATNSRDDMARLAETPII